MLGMDVNDTVHTVRLRFDLKLQLQSKKKLHSVNGAFKGFSYVTIVTAKFLSQQMGYIGFNRTVWTAL